MSSRPAHTLLLIKSDLIARADFGPGPSFERLGFSQQAQGKNARPFYSVEAALKLGGRCGKSVWVLGEEFWTQTLSMPAAALRGLDREQIARAVAFDVEALTGLSGSESFLGFSKAAGEDEHAHLWVTQVPLAARAQIQTAISRAGGKLAGILHPGGLPAPIDDVSGPAELSRTWRRIEVWKEATVCLIGTGFETPRVTILNGEANQEAWRAGVLRWIAANPAVRSHWLGPRGLMPAESFNEGPTAWNLLPPLNGDALERWMGQWMPKLAGGAKLAPVVEPNQAGARQRQHLAMAAGIAFICLAGCGACASWFAHQESMLRAESNALTKEAAEKQQRLAMLEAPRREWDQLRRSIQAKNTELTRLTAAQANIAYHPPPDFACHRTRLHALLDALRKCACADLMIEHIEPATDGGLIVSGASLPSSPVDEFVTRLHTALQPCGWEVGPARQSTLGIIPNGQFTFGIASAQSGIESQGKDHPSASLTGVTR